MSYFDIDDFLSDEINIPFLTSADETIFHAELFSKHSELLPLTKIKLPLYLASALHEENFGNASIPEEVTSNIAAFRIENHHELLVLPEWIYKWIIKLDILIQSQDTEVLFEMIYKLCGLRIVAIFSRVDSQLDYTLRNALQPEEKRIYDIGVHQCHEYRQYRMWGSEMRVRKQKERMQKRRRAEQTLEVPTSNKGSESSEMEAEENTEGELNRPQKRARKE